MARTKGRKPKRRAMTRKVYGHVYGGQVYGHVYGGQVYGQVYGGASFFSRKVKLIRAEDTDALTKLLETYPPNSESDKIKAILNILSLNYNTNKDDKKPKIRIFPARTEPPSTEIEAYEKVILMGPENSDREMKHYNTRLKGEISYRLYSYLYNTLTLIHNELEDNKTSATPMTEKDAEEKLEMINFIRELIRRVDLLRKPMWAQSLVDTIKQMFNEGYDRKKELDDYYDKLNPSGKKGVRVWMDVNVDFSDDRVINNPQCDDDKREYTYKARVSQLGDTNTHKQVNDMLNKLFYENEITTKNTKAMEPIAKYRHDIVHQGDKQKT